MILVILGPTATGKTDLALKLAKRFDGELVACDSRQVYKGLDIGTGKLPGIISKHGGNVKGNGYWVVDGVKIWMYDLVDPKKQYSVADYVKDARRAIQKIIKRGKLPIIVGGTGLYLKAILYGLSNLVIPVDKKLRKRLEKLSLDKLQRKLRELSLGKWQKMNSSDRKNPRRLVRAIELALSNHKGDPSTRPSINSGLAQDDKLRLKIVRSLSNTLKIGLTAPRQLLYKRVDDRVVDRIGMIEEAKKLYKGGLSLKRMRQLGLEYGVLADYLSGEIREIWGDKGLIRKMQHKIHGYVRRQLAWFKKEKDVVWFDITKEDFVTRVENKVAKWYHPY